MHIYMYTSVCTCVCTLKCVHTCVCVCVCVWRCRRKTRNIFRKKGRYDVVSSSQLMTDEKSSYFRQIRLWQILPTVDPYKLQAIPSETQTLTNPRPPPRNRASQPSCRTSWAPKPRNGKHEAHAVRTRGPLSLPRAGRHDTCERLTTSWFF